MNKHDYCIETMGKIIMEFERCANASIKTIELLVKAGRYTTEQADEIIAHIKALCRMQDNHISPILSKEIGLSMNDLGGDENAL